MQQIDRREEEEGKRDGVSEEHGVLFWFWFWFCFFCFCFVSIDVDVEICNEARMNGWNVSVALDTIMLATLSLINKGKTDGFILDNHCFGKAGCDGVVGHFYRIHR